MSHLSKIEIEVTDIRVLAAACQRLNLIFQEGKNKFIWFNGHADCNHAILIPGAKYEVGVINNGKRYDIKCDFFDSGIAKSIGKNGGRLKQAYAAEKTIIEARRKGYSVIETITEDKVRIRLRVDA